VAHFHQKVSRIWGAVSLVAMLVGTPAARASTDVDDPFLVDDHVEQGATTTNPTPTGVILTSVHTSPDAPKYQWLLTLPCQIDKAGSQDTKCLGSNRNAQKCPAGADHKEAGYLAQYRYAPVGLSDPEWSQWTNDGAPTCVYNPQEAQALLNIPGRVAREFQSRKIAAAEFGVQPQPHTLIGFNTNFYSHPTKQTFPLTLLGQRIMLTVYPVTSTYDYGDGTTLGPTELEGSALPNAQWGTETRTSHAYQRTGDFTASVTTRFHGSYSINGGPTMPIPGEATVTSPGVRLSVWRSKVDWYADDCNQNPHGAGC